MKNFLLLLLLLSISSLIAAQQTGTVYYHEKAKLHFNIQGDAPPPPNLPTERNASTILIYTGEASIYMNDPAKDQDATEIEEESDEGGHMHIRMQTPDNRSYCDLANGTCLDQRDFMQRKFLIERDLKSADWKLTGKQKMVLNYPCQEATKQVDDKKISAWFAPSIPVSVGPSGYTGLPGLVLEVIINDGDQVITASAVKQGEADASLIVKPKDGKKVTQEEFKKIVDEKMKEMGVEGGGGNNVIIRIQDH